MDCIVKPNKMSGLGYIASIPQVLAGVLSAIIAFFAIRVFYPLVAQILGLWTTTSFMSVIANIIMWLIITFIVYVGIWNKMFSPIMDKLKGNVETVRV